MNKVNQTVHAQFSASLKQLNAHCSDRVKRITLPLQGEESRILTFEECLSEDSGL